MKIHYSKGQIINGLTFIEETNVHITPNGRKFRKAIFKCFCGNEFETWITSVKAGLTKSCGCFETKKRIETHTTHGLYKHPLYVVWKNMKQRCYNPNATRYSDWGGRGISVCDEWINDFQAFYDWAVENGYKKGLQLDRIDNDGNYEPTNCRFITLTKNIRNSRATKLNINDILEIRNAKLLIPNLTMTELSKAYHVTVTTISDILKENHWRTV